MAIVPAPSSPTVAVSRELRRLGLQQGPGKDFRVLGHMVNGERDHTYVNLLTAEARQLVADHADDLEGRLADGPFPFTVSVRYFDSPHPMVSIHNGAAERIRDEKPAAEDVAEGAPAEETAAPAVEDAPAEETAVPADVDVPDSAEDVAEGAPGEEAAEDAPAEETAVPADVDVPDSAEDVAEGAPGEEAAEDAPAEETAVPADVDVPDVEASDAPDSAERYKQRRQAAALLWSVKQAEVIRAAVAGHLFRDDFADAYRRSADRAQTGRRVSGSFLVPLGEAGFLVMGEPGPDGRRLVEATADARHALMVWDLHQPTPTERNHKQERMPLTPLLGGEEAARRSAELLADDERRRQARTVWLASYREQRAAEDREARLRDAWARVEGIRNPCSKRPAGWAPTDEQAAEHGLSPDVVAELRAEAARPAEGCAPAQAA